MKSISAALFLIALVSAQAGFVDYIFNHTNLRGKATLNTTNGLSLGYNGALTYNLSGYNLTIIDLGVNFDANPQAMTSVNGTQNVTVRYSGGVAVNGSVGQSNATVSGVTGVSQTFSSQFDNRTQTTNVTFTQSVSDSNSLVVRTASSLVTAKTTTGFSAGGLVQQKGNDIRVSENIGYNVSSRGTVTVNGTSLGAFTTTRASNANVLEKLRLNTNATGRQPTVTFDGIVGFTDDKYLAFQGTTTNVTKRGGAKFGGHSWVKKGNDSLGVATAEGVAYGYKENVTVNGTLVHKIGSMGGAGIYHAVQTNTTSNGSSISAFQAGKVKQFSRTWVPTINGSNRTTSGNFVELMDSENAFGTEESSLEYFDADENGEFLQADHSKKFRPQHDRHHGDRHHHDRHHHDRHHHDKHHHDRHCRNNTVNSFFEAGWKSGTHTTTALVSNTTVQVNSTNGAVYGARGWVGTPRKRWENNGNKTITASFKQTVGTSNLDDIVVRLDENPAFMKKLSNLSVPSMVPKKMN